MNSPPACARPRARDASGRFAKGHSGNPRGRPPGIPNPRRRPLRLLLPQARPGALAPLIERKPHLRLPVLRLILPEPARQPDPGDLLGIDFSRMRTARQIAAAMGRLVAATGHGEITPGEAARLARRSRKPLRAIRRAQWRELAELAKRARARDKVAAGEFGARASRPPDAAGTAAVTNGKSPVKHGKIPCSQGIAAPPIPRRGVKWPAAVSRPDNARFHLVFRIENRGKSRAGPVRLCLAPRARAGRRNAMILLPGKRIAAGSPNDA